MQVHINKNKNKSGKWDTVIAEASGESGESEAQHSVTFSHVRYYNSSALVSVESYLKSVSMTTRKKKKIKSK